MSGTTYLISLQDGDLTAIIETAVAAALDKRLPLTPTQPAEDVYYTRGELKDKFGVSLVTIDKWRTRGLLPSHKIGCRRFFRAADVSALFERGEK